VHLGDCRPRLHGPGDCQESVTVRSETDACDRLRGRGWCQKSAHVRGPPGPARPLLVTDVGGTGPSRSSSPLASRGPRCRRGGYPLVMARVHCPAPSGTAKRAHSRRPGTCARRTLGARSLGEPASAPRSALPAAARGPSRALVRPHSPPPAVAPRPAAGPARGRGAPTPPAPARLATWPVGPTTSPRHGRATVTRSPYRARPAGVSGGDQQAVPSRRASPRSVCRRRSPRVTALSPPRRHALRAVGNASCPARRPGRRTTAGVPAPASRPPVPVARGSGPHPPAGRPRGTRAPARAGRP
jgi:hypothetical protein